MTNCARKQNESNVTVAGRKSAAIICKPCVTNVSVGEFRLSGKILGSFFSFIVFCIFAL